jgi:hypothetical protein
VNGCQVSWLHKRRSKKRERGDSSRASQTAYKWCIL